MHFPNEHGVPLWLFVLVILLSLVAVVAIFYMVWRNCIRQPRGVEHLSSSGSEPPRSRVSVRKGQIVRSSWNISLTSPRFGSGSSRQPSPSYQWPVTIYSGKAFGNGQPSTFQGGTALDPPSGDDLTAMTQRSWSDLFRKQARADSVSTDEESARPSYISDSFGSVGQFEESRSGLKQTPHETQWLTSSSSSSPFGALTPPKTLGKPVAHATNPAVASQSDTTPSIPRRTYDWRPYCEDTGPQQNKQETQLAARKQGLSSSRVVPQGQASGFSPNSSSFIYAWPNRHKQRADKQGSSFISAPSKVDASDSSPIHPPTTPNRPPEGIDEDEKTIGMPSPIRTMSSKSDLLISRADSVSPLSMSTYRSQKDVTGARGPLKREAEISWLVDD